jgi:excisionase family DNA binding protein
MNEAQNALLLKPADAAKALAISPRKLWALTASGEIPHVRIGKCVRYPLSDLQRWIAANTTGSGQIRP